MRRNLLIPLALCVATPRAAAFTGARAGRALPSVARLPPSAAFGDSSSRRRVRRHPSASPLRASIGSEDLAGEAFEAFRLEEVLPLIAKMLVVLGIKTAKDILNYPIMILDRMLLEEQQGRTNEAVMLFKFMIVLTFKVLHDIIYYPTQASLKLMQCETREELEQKIVWCATVLAAYVSYGPKEFR